MKKLKLVKLAELSSEEKKQVKGGQAIIIVGPLCQCGCRYAGSGGSSSTDNACANADGGLH